jgi:hypothetical protein
VWGDRRAALGRGHLGVWGERSTKAILTTHAHDEHCRVRGASTPPQLACVVTGDTPHSRSGRLNRVRVLVPRRAASTLLHLRGTARRASTHDGRPRPMPWATGRRSSRVPPAHSAPRKWARVTARTRSPRRRGDATLPLRVRHDRTYARKLSEVDRILLVDELLPEPSWGLAPPTAR